MDEDRKQNWLDHFGIVKYSAHASGHAADCEIIEMINEIKPDNVIPVHTQKPELLRGLERILSFIEAKIGFRGEK